MDVEARILAELSEDEYVSGEAISGKLDISRSAVWKHVRSLRRHGYEIRAAPRRGYIIARRPDKLIASELYNRLDTAVVGSRIEHYDVIGSTADAARDMAVQGVPEGTVLVAESQTAGRGRMDRGWLTPAGQAVALTVVLYPSFPPPAAPLLGLAAGLAVREAIESVTGLAAQVKWPNDIYLGGRKVAGVLLEMAAELDRVKWVTLSVGINVNNSFAGTGLEGTAASLRGETGGAVSRLEVAAAFLTALDRFYNKGVNGTAAAKIVDSFQSAHMLQGQQVMVRTPSGRIRGSVEGIDPDGRLLLQGEDGVLHALFSGEATLAQG